MICIVKRVMTPAPFDRIMRKCGAERVSEGAAIELRDVIEDISEDLSRDIIAVARHAGRKTVKKEDIDLVMAQR